MNTVERRLEILNMEGSGFSKAEIVKELSVKGDVSERAVYKDFERRDKWQPLLTADKQVHRIINLYEQIYRKAALKYLSSKNENVQLGALKIMFETVKQLEEILVLPELVGRLKTLEVKAKGGVFVK